VPAFGAAAGRRRRNADMVVTIDELVKKKSPSAPPL
jgi:hypothetical protein